MKEDIIFSLYKDKPIRTAKEFRKEIENKYKDVNTKELYLRITNYQLDKYGHSLWDYDNEYKTYDDYKLNIISAKNRRRAKERYWRNK
jgi:hypothetical protein